MRCLGLDLGSKRIGVALCDPDERVATPLTVVQRGKSRKDDHAKIAAAAGKRSRRAAKRLGVTGG